MLKQEIDFFMKKITPILSQDIEHIFRHRNRSIKYFFTEHFEERLAERCIVEELPFVIKMLRKTFKEHICELLYFLNMENPPFRGEIIHEQYLICFSINQQKQKIYFRTIIKDNKYQGKERTFKIVLK